MTIIASAAQGDDGDLLVDLSGVTFMDASTIGALVESRNRLASLSRRLELRAPSRPARGVLELFGFAELGYRTEAEAVLPGIEAHTLGTLVADPSSRIT